MRCDTLHIDRATRLLYLHFQRESGLEKVDYPIEGFEKGNESETQQLD